METLTDTQMDEYLHNLVYKLPEIESITIAYDPSKPSIHKTRSIYHKNNQLVIQSLFNSDYQFVDWFQLPSVMQRKVWSEPWFDAEDREKP
jgi:hypothetical protein